VPIEHLPAASLAGSLAGWLASWLAGCRLPRPICSAAGAGEKRPRVQEDGESWAVLTDVPAGKNGFKAFSPVPEEGVCV
jgi:hypothetical protein